MQLPYSPPGERTLRGVAIFTWLPGLILAIVAGIKVSSLNSFITIMPLCFTLFSGFGYYYINRQSRQSSSNNNIGLSASLSVKEQTLLQRIAWALVDFSIAGAYLGVLVPTWVEYSHGGRGYGGYYYWYINNSPAMLETYATTLPLAHM
jgi:hypothetical protein